MRLTILILMLLLTGTAGATIIENVVIMPENPTEFDLITIDVFGQCSGDIGYESYEIEYIEPENLYDISLYFGPVHHIQIFPLPDADWQATVELGYVPEGNYVLGLSPEGGHPYFTSLTVTPEPASLLLFSMGTIVVVRRRKR